MKYLLDYLTNCQVLNQSSGQSMYKVNYMEGLYEYIVYIKANPNQRAIQGHLKYLIAFLKNIRRQILGSNYNP